MVSGDFMQYLLNKEQFDLANKKDIYYNGRWEDYIKDAVEILSVLKFETVLETGPYLTPLVVGEDSRFSYCGFTAKKSYLLT
jgi:hypothetical protein